MVLHASKGPFRLLVQGVPYNRIHADAPAVVDIYEREADGLYYMYYPGHPNVYYKADQTWAHGMVSELMQRSGN